MTPADLDNRFSFHPADTVIKQRAHEHVRSRCRYLAQILDDDLPDGREKSLAMTKLEEVMFWANAAIARDTHSTPPEG
ncbi:hypothetical protein HD597_010073 [Nonomuraea thailandensis]|uniref:Acb2/Tad1 hairpin domain-containing protein n=1 Tax=Nonomuraea thailandensis TaxID=1188745 RepID=A0A9X2K7D4_9ACTN|nr:hypothetical protein [Nonomuraea thailandensis]MCP2363053.1 hypothetical protein [Nonomuraea thailandensis]